MANSKRVQLTERLISKTEKGELAWKETADANAFQLAFPKYSLIINEVINRQSSETDIVITLLNSEGNTIDQFSDVDLRQETGDTYFPRMKALHDSARRKALRVEEAIDDILKELDDDDIPF